MGEVSFEVVQRCAQGDPDALGEIYRVYGARVYALCRRMTGNEADAQDATQEVFLRVWNQAAKFDGRTRFSAWLYRLALHHLINFCKVRKRHRRFLSTQIEDHALAGRNPQPPEAAELAEEESLLDQLLESLSPKQRAVVVLRELEGMTYAGIAEALQIPKGTVMSRLARARRRLLDLARESGLFD